MKYAAKRILVLLVTMVIVSFLAFAAFEVIGGDPATAILGTQATPERLEALREELGLNRPFLTRYAEWLLGFFTGDLGMSYQYRQPVLELLQSKLSVTLMLSFVSFILIVAVSIPLGLLSSRMVGKRLDGLHTAFNQLCMAVPPFFTGILLSYLFGITLKWFMPGNFPGLGNNFLGSLKYLFFAAISIAIPRIAMTVRMLRSIIVREMNQAYVRTAISRGNDRGQVLRNHVLKNALVPVVTFLAQTMAEIMAGSVVVEQVFGIPGLGRMLVSSVANRDYPVVETLVVILAFWVVLAGTVADLLNQRIDPRLRLGADA
ncbi:MAG: ABC transporter permease [Oscillibacter sp.]|nr:ABC transporter permease [Oscillibacter sp.]